MAELIQCSRAGHSLTDFLVCSTLRYLDSSTSYREYLARMHNGALEESEFVILDEGSSNCSQASIAVIGVLVSVICLLWLRG